MEQAWDKMEFLQDEMKRFQSQIVRHGEIIKNSKCLGAVMESKTLMAIYSQLYDSCEHELTKLVKERYETTKALDEAQAE